MSADWAGKFTHNPDVPGFLPLVEVFAEFVSGRIKRDVFMVDWDKTSDEARVEFKKFMKSFNEVMEQLK